MQHIKMIQEAQDAMGCTPWKWHCLAAPSASLSFPTKHWLFAPGTPSLTHLVFLTSSW